MGSGIGSWRTWSGAQAAKGKRGGGTGGELDEVAEGVARRLVLIGTVVEVAEIPPTVGPAGVLREHGLVELDGLRSDNISFARTWERSPWIGDDDHFLKNPREGRCDMISSLDSLPVIPLSASGEAMLIPHGSPNLLPELNQRRWIIWVYGMLRSWFNEDSTLVLSTTKHDSSGHNRRIC